MYMCSSVTDIALDVAILCLPASFVRKLQVTRTQKLALTAIFGLGILYGLILLRESRSRANPPDSCTVASIARLVYTVNLEQANIDQNFEANFGRMCTTLSKYGCC